MCVISHSGMENQRDIDETIKFVNTWDETTDRLLEENQDCKRQIFLLTKKCELNKNNEFQLKQEIDRLHKIVTTLQSTLESQMQIIAENEQLKNHITKLKEKVSLLEEECKQKETDKNNQLEVLHNFSKTECANLRKENEEKLNGVRTSMQTIVAEKEKKIQELKEHNSLLMKEKQNEIMKVRLDYDAKLQRLQQKHVSMDPQQTKSSSSSIVRNDILRRKLQHTQVEAQREIDALKKKICDLEKALEEKSVQKKRKLSFH